MFYDVTPILMHDPCTRDVRPPTERERTQARRRYGPSTFRWDDMNVGDVERGLSAREAKNARTWFWANGLTCTIREEAPGVYRVERVR